MNWFKSCLLKNMSTAILSASPAAAAAARHRNTADSKPTIDQEEEISKTAASVAVAFNTAGNNSNNGGECLVCGDGGELICCDTFDRVYHGKCLPGDDHGTLPGRWRCPICDSESCESKKMPAKNPVKSQHEQAHGENKNNSDGGTPRKKRKCDKNSDDHCYICCYGGLLVCCDHCDKSFHMNCHVPPLQSIPEGEWKCCECAAASFSVSVDNFLSGCVQSFHFERIKPYSMNNEYFAYHSTEEVQMWFMRSVFEGRLWKVCSLPRQAQVWWQ
mmetsp:Transcript_15854/g.28050  ORF Transcript_15854/g.28050 Transcript_15854/m.28050 type:complete len:273 (-) Transcript_15854:834-1652(-)